MTQRLVLQFKMTLQEIEPAIWRRIQLVDTCSFWDIHVDIQDAMGWTDSHLHYFDVLDPTTNNQQLIGIPCDDVVDDDTLPGWEYFVKNYIKKNDHLIYLYDFGDSWFHTIEFEGVHQARNTNYPICLDGENACPPEDVGGVPGYYEFVKIMRDKKHKEYQSMLTWYGKQYDPTEFDSKQVEFHNPKIRWKQAIG